MKVDDGMPCVDTDTDTTSIDDKYDYLVTSRCGFEEALT